MHVMQTFCAMFNDVGNVSRLRSTLSCQADLPPLHGFPEPAVAARPDPVCCSRHPARLCPSYNHMAAANTLAQFLGATHDQSDL